MRATAVAVTLTAALLGGGVAATPVLADTVAVSINISGPTQVGQALTISGDVTGASSYPQMLSAQRVDSAGSHPLAGATTNSAGHYSFTDTPPVRGKVTYTVTVDPGGPSNQASVQEAGKPAPLRLELGRYTVSAGHSVRVTAHLGSGPTNRDVTIYARPYAGDRRQIDQGAVDVNGDRSVRVPVQRRTTFSVHFAGDSVYAPAVAHRVVKVRAVLDEQLRGGYASSGGYRLYHPGSNPAVFVQMLPKEQGRCLHFRAQHYYSGSWHNSTVSPCLRTNSQGQKIGVLTGSHVVGEPYRVRAEWRGSFALLARNGVWLRLKFHR